MKGTFLQPSTLPVSTSEGQRSALVVSPAERLVYGRERLQQLRGARFETLSPVDQEFVLSARNTVPEPTTLALMAGSLGVLGFRRHSPGRRRQAT